MEGRLKKIGNEYKLYAQDDSCIATSWYSPYQRLSKNNCQAIENGYDLDELAKVSYDCDPYIAEYLEHEFKKGFQKALEILGDKKFSESDLRIGCNLLLNLEKEKDELSEVFIDRKYRYIDSIIQSLQQTKWEVTFNPDEKYSDGCLILKRK